MFLVLLVLFVLGEAEKACTANGHACTGERSVGGTSLLQRKTSHDVTFEEDEAGHGSRKDGSLIKKDDKNLKECNCCEYDIMYQGWDLAGQPVRASSGGECQALCQELEGCEAFNWRPHGKACHLKKGILKWTDKSGHVSGPRDCPAPTPAPTPPPTPAPTPEFATLMFPKGIEKTLSLSQTDYEEIVSALHAVYDGVPDEIDDNTNKRGSLVGCLLRTAGHDFMDFRYSTDSGTDGPSTGGADGCIYLADPDNKGIPSCLIEFDILGLYGRFNETVSLADFLVIIAEAAAGRTATGWSSTNRWHPDSLEFRFRQGFKYGRKTVETCNYPGRMPNPEHGCEGRGADKPGLKQIFVEQIYRGQKYPWTLTAAISGAHTVGSAKLENSGYDGHWSTAEMQGRFNNNYYKKMLMNGWVPSRSVGGNDDKNQWALGDRSGGGSHKEMMLTTDLCLAFASTPTRAKCEEKVNEKAHQYYNEAGDSADEQVDLDNFDGHQFFCRYLFEHVGPESEMRASEGFADLDPTHDMCCAWISPVTVLRSKLYPTPSEQFVYMINSEDEPMQKIQSSTEWQHGHEFCGITTENGTDLKIDPWAKGRKSFDCCNQHLPEGVLQIGEGPGQMRKECDNIYSSRGLAWPDVVDFAREEFLFYKWYVKAWNIATENGHEDLQCLMTDCGSERDKPTAKEEVECNFTKTEWLQATGEMMRAYPSCQIRRVGDSYSLHPDNGLNAPHNWFKLNREFIPEELANRGCSVYNLEQCFELKFVDATASSIGRAWFDHQLIDMPPSNLLKSSSWREDMAAALATGTAPFYEDGVWNRASDLPFTMYGRTSTCWVSQNETKPRLTLKFEKVETVHKVVVAGPRKSLLKGQTKVQFMNGAQTYLTTDGASKETCGPLYATENKEVPANRVCQIKSRRDGTTRPPKGNELTFKFGVSGEYAGPYKICAVWAFKYDPMYSHLIEVP